VLVVSTEDRRLSGPMWCVGCSRGYNGAGALF